MRYLAVDHGTKRTGLAICDPGETIVSPLAVIEGQQGLIEMIARTVATEHVEAIVLGLPLNMDDSAGPQAKLVLKFAERLENVLDIPVHFQDERLSTFGAEDKLAAAELTKKKKKKHLDAIAAAEILETFLQDKNR
ncbi:MAG: Holliday junction resolvase RuvX [Planctomycetota bacterium]|jgi:putative Holliday junction resolvase